MASDQPKEAVPPNTRLAIDPTDHSLNARQQMLVLTEEEKLVMKECDRDSFFQRALPLSFGTMLGAYTMVRTGRWNPHPKLGSLPKVLIAGGVGYFIGKVSYVPVCQQKIVEKIPHSNLAAAVRKSKGIPEPEASAATLDEVGGSVSTRVKDDYSALEGLDDRFRPTMDRDVKESVTPQEKGSISYEELRRKNREEYQKSKVPPRAQDTPSNRDSPLMPQKQWPDSKSQNPDISLESPAPPPSGAPSTKKRTNIWGDPIDD